MKRNFRTISINKGSKLLKETIKINQKKELEM